MKDPAGRTRERLRFHYDVEQELASRLRSASKADRTTLYSSLYDELFQRVTDHPQHAIKNSEEDKSARVSDRMASMRGLLSSETRFMEIGAGDCAFSFAVAARVREVIAIDVSDAITRASSVPGNFRLILSNGTSIPVEPDSIDFAYSDQLMEHLHPDDALEQLMGIARALKPGGLYFCRTPNRLSGPHDVSQHFGDVATGFHLREYTLRELSELFASLGLARQRVLVGGVGYYLNWPLWPIKVLEAMLDLLPQKVRRAIATTAIGRALLGVRLIAYKAY